MTLVARLRALLRPRSDTVPAGRSRHDGARALLSLSSPPCDCCGQDTRKPWLWRNTHTRWLCGPCEQKATDEMFDMYRRLNAHQDAMFRLRAGLPPRDEEPTA